MMMMNKLLLTLTLLVLTSSFCMAQEIASSASDIDVIKLIRDVETQYQGKTSHGKMQMNIKTKSWARTLSIEFWGEGRDKMLTRILSPAKERGTCTLKVDDDIWNYISRIDRLIKIPSSLMGDSWMGSHFTNDDLVKENKIDQLYHLKVSSKKDKQIEITGTPLPDAAVVWGKIVYRIDSEKMVPVDISYFDEEGALVRTMTFSDIQQVNQRNLPMKAKILPIEKPDEYTEIVYEKIDFDIDLEANLFSIKSLRNR